MKIFREIECSNFSPLLIGIDRRCDAGNSVTGEFLTHQPTSLNQNIFISIILTTKGHIFRWTFLNKLQRGFQISFCQHICCNVMLFQKYNFCKKKVIYSEIITPKLQIHFYKRYLRDVVRKRMTRKMTLFFMPTSLWISVFPIIISSPSVKFREIQNHFFFITDQT